MLNSDFSLLFKSGWDADSCEAEVYFKLNWSFNLSIIFSYNLSASSLNIIFVTMKYVVAGKEFYALCIVQKQQFYAMACRPPHFIRLSIVLLSLPTAGSELHGVQ